MDAARTRALETVSTARLALGMADDLPDGMADQLRDVVDDLRDEAKSKGGMARLDTDTLVRYAAEIEEVMTAWGFPC